MSKQSARPAPYRQASRWIISITAAGLLAALMGAGLLRPREPRTVSQVREEIYRIILDQNEEASWDSGGIIGPWHVAATSFDVSTGELRDFRLVSGSINLGAARARLKIDAERDTITFELREVVIVSVPPERGVQPPDHHLIPLDSFILGPVEYHHPIVPDGQPIR